MPYARTLGTTWLPDSCVPSQKLTLAMSKDFLGKQGENRGGTEEPSLGRVISLGDQDPAFSEEQKLAQASQRSNKMCVLPELTGTKPECICNSSAHPCDPQSLCITLSDQLPLALD